MHVIRSLLHDIWKNLKQWHFEKLVKENYENVYWIHIAVEISASQTKNV